jgi:GGDEF domain-containing protein
MIYVDLHRIFVDRSVGLTWDSMMETHSHRFTPIHTDIAALMRATDRAMYRAKALGKSRTVFAEGADFDATLGAI